MRVWGKMRGTYVYHLVSDITLGHPMGHGHFWNCHRVCQLVLGVSDVLSIDTQQSVYMSPSAYSRPISISINYADAGIRMM